MSNQRVLVTYATAPSSQSSDGWKHFLTALRSQLPLRNIHWKSPSRPTLRTIQELEISLVALESVRDEHTSQIPVTLLEKPLLNLYVVSCEDAETYKATVKKQIKDWQTSVIQRRNQEWLIIHVVRPDVKNVDRKFFTMKGSVLDKIKADFNVDKRDRCVQLAWSVGERSPAVWADLISKIKDGLLSALDTAVSSREDELKRSEGQRHMPGWNFCTYFILKESLATSFEGVNLFEDALQQYNELDSAFMNVLREKNMSWFGNLINPAPKDDSLPLLSTSKKSYRDLILANTISVFDLRVYLLARQSALLSRMRRPIEICRKAVLFLNTFGKRLWEAEAELPEYFVESWMFSSALSVVDQCNTWTSSWPEMEEVALARYNASKGELLELAKSQLDILGIKVGHLPRKPPFSMALHTAVTAPPSGKVSSAHRISKYEIMLAIGDREAFYDFYCTISNRAIDMYVKAGRRKFALKLHGCLAALDNHRGRLPNALSIFSSLPAHYAPHMWTSLESYMLSRAIDTHLRLNKPYDREWIHILLAFLKAYVNESGSETLVSRDINEYVTGLVSSLRQAAESLDSDLSHPDHPAVSFHFPEDARYSEDEDTVCLVVLVHNHLPCDVVVDEVSVILMGEDTNCLKFSAKADKLVAGKYRLTLTCATASHGTYVAESIEVQMAHLHLHWNLKSANAGSAPRKRAPLVHIPRNPEGLDVQLRLPFKMKLLGPPHLQEGVKIRGCCPSLSVMVSKASGIRASLTGEIKTNPSPVLDPLQLVISYRLLREGMAYAFKEVFCGRSQDDSHDSKLVDKIIEHLEDDASWVELYNATGEVMIPSSLAVGESLTEALTSVQKVLSQPRLLSAPHGMWREMAIPVDVPRMNIIADTWIAIQSTSTAEDVQGQPSPIYAGQPLSATLSVTTYLHWSDPESKHQQYRMRYDVEERTKDWLISGRKRGDFSVQVLSLF
ncbi:hypothetical protein ID866_2158 [Astraeus odoratus]|nr:hypothetical protein ID866_2158 [Astraeus odoratus]